MVFIVAGLSYISHQQSIKVPSSTSLLVFVVACFLNDSHSSQVRWNLSVVFMCVSLIVNETEHFSSHTY